MSIYSMAEFFEAEQINKILRCSRCSNKYDIPLLMPCGETICNKCLQTDQISNQINCHGCTRWHFVPVEGFPKNKAIVQLINEQAHEFYRGKPIEMFNNKLEGYLIDIEILRNHKKMLIDTMAYHCNDLRNEIEQEVEDLMRTMRENQANLLYQISVYEKSFIENVDADLPLKEKFEIRADLAQMFYDKWRSYMTSTQIDISEIEAAQREIDEFKVEIEKEMDLVFKRYFKHFLVFNKNKNATKMITNCLGSIDVEKVALPKYKLGLQAANKLIPRLKRTFSM
jgi:hypothetical protein